MPALSTFAALRERDYRLYYGGLLLSLTGTWLERSALAWLVYRMTGDSESWLGLTVGVQAVPALLLSVPAGALADRIPVKQMVLVTQTLMLIGAFVMGGLVLADLVEPWHIVLYSGITAGVFACDAPARQALVVRIVGTENLTNAFALNATTFQIGQVLGGAAFGVLLAYTSIGEGGCLILNGVSFTAVLVSLLMIRERPGARSAAGADRHPLRGLQYALRTPVVRAGLLLSFTLAFFGFQVGQILPVYAKAVWEWDAGGFAYLRGALGVGAFIGALVLATRSASIHRGRLVLRYGLVAPFLLALFAWSPSLPLGAAALACCGFIMIQCHACSSAMIQMTVPDELRGRVSALYTLTILGSFPLGGLAAGLAAEHIGAPSTTTIAAALLLVAVIVIHTAHKPFREMV